LFAGIEIHIEDSNVLHVIVSLSALLLSDLQFVDYTVLEGAAKGALDPIERLWPDS